MGSGVSAFGLTKYPEDIVTRQACAGVGQARLMETYGALLSNFDITVAQVLLTATDLATPEKAGYVSSKLERILEEPRGLPIINENDSVAIKGVDLWQQRHVVTHGLPR